MAIVDLLAIEISVGFPSLHHLVELFLDVESLELKEPNLLGVCLKVDSFMRDAGVGEQLCVEGVRCINHLHVDFSLGHLIVLLEPVVGEFDQAGFLESLEWVNGLRHICSPEAFDNLRYGSIGPRMGVHAHH